MAMRDYLIGEVAEEFVEGLLSRREALRRLCLLGLGMTAATSVLAACGTGSDDTASEGSPSGEGTKPSESPSASASPSASSTPTAQPTPGPEAGKLITFPGKAGDLSGAFKAPDGDPKGAVLVMHENKGLTTHFYELVGRFAKDGYAALCVDLVSRAGGTAKYTDQAEATAKLNELTDDQLLDDLRSGLDELSERAPDAKVGAVGFCFGGGTTWKLLDAGEERILAALPFYGTPPEDPDFSKAKAAVLAVYAGNDARVNATREAAEEALKSSGLTYEIKTYDGAEHAFFNDTSPRYNAEAAAQARTAMLDWFAKYLK
jgi:carboxymethylenebutenolidase